MKDKKEIKFSFMTLYGSLYLRCLSENLISFHSRERRQKQINIWCVRKEEKKKKLNTVSFFGFMIKAISKRHVVVSVSFRSFFA